MSRLRLSFAGDEAVYLGRDVHGTVNLVWIVLPDHINTYCKTTNRQ